MAKTNLYDMNGKVVGEIELNDSVFGIEPNITAMHTTVKNYLANQRQGTQSTLTRAEVRGGGRKPWRQKGTGRARQGSIRAPQWIHGGIAFGPKPRSYRFSINKKLRQLAMRSALSSSLADGKLMIVDNIQLDEIKTKGMTRFLGSIDAPGKSLLVTPEVRNNVVLSARNLPGVKTVISSVLCVYDVLNADKLIMDQAAVKKLEEVYAQ